MSQLKKCQECGKPMGLKKSSKGEGNKFWGCTGYPECKAIIQYYGRGARAGLSIDVREIANGLVITVTQKFVDNQEDDDPVEYYCKPEQLDVVLASIWTTQVQKITERVTLQGGFDKDEAAETKKAQARKITMVSPDPGGSRDIDHLIEKAKKKPARAD